MGKGQTESSPLCSLEQRASECYVIKKWLPATNAREKGGSGQGRPGSSSQAAAKPSVGNQGC